MADLFDEFQIGQPSIPQAETGDLLDEFSITPPEPESKGVTGHIRDLGVSALSSTVLVPEAAVGFMDMQTRGRMGKRLEEAGFRPKEAKETINSWHTDQFKEQQRAFAEADGVVDKAQVALENSSLIGNAVVESLPLMGAGALLARGALRAAPGLAKTKTGTAVAAATGEGAVMAGSQAEAIRQQTEDGYLTGEQVGYAGATGILGAVFGYASARLAQKLGVGDVDTMLASGVKPSQVAAELAATPAKSVPRQVIEGAITEGFLEELPQSVSEQILQNLALNKPWSEGVDDAAVMGTLAGMAMGGPAAGYNALSAPAPQPNPQANPEAEAHGSTEQAPIVTPPNTPAVDAGVPPMPAAPLANAAAPVAPTPAPAAQVTPAPATVQPKPSEQMGLNPNAGALSAAAAIAVDTGASPAVVVAEQPAEQPVHGSLKRAADLAAQGAQAEAAPSWVQDWQESLGQPAPEVNPLTGEIAPAGSDLLAADPAADLQDRLSHIQQQARATGWDARLIAERDKLKAELDALPTSATPKATTGMQGEDHPAVAGWLTKRLSDFKEKYQIPDGADIDATIEQNIDSPNAARAGRARVMRSGLNDLRKELDAARAWLQANPDQASALTADAQLDYADPVSSLEFYKTGQRPRSMVDDAREAAGYGPASDQPTVKDANIERQREDKRLLARPSAQMVEEAAALGVQDADKYRNVQALEFAMAEARKAPTPQQPADQATVSPETVTAPATAEARIQAVIAKQIPEMSDAEIEQAIAHYGPDHKRTAKLKKEQAKRGESKAVTNGDTVQVSDTLGSDIDGQLGTVLSVSGDSASVVVAGERYDGVPVSELTKPQQTESTNGIQATETQQAGTQRAQATGAAAGQAPAAAGQDTAAGTEPAGKPASVATPSKPASVKDGIEQARQAKKAGIEAAANSLSNGQFGATQTLPGKVKGQTETKQLMRADDGSLYWGDWHTKKHRDLGVITGGKDKDGTPAYFATKAEAVAAALSVSAPTSTASTTSAASKPVVSTAPEHESVGVDDRELDQIVSEFNAAQSAMRSEGVHHLFDAPEKKEVVRLADKAKVYHAQHGWMTPDEAKAKIAEWREHAQAQGYNRENSQKVVLSLFDKSGAWSRPWEEAGYQVYRFDIQDSDVYEDPETGEEKKIGDVNNMSVEFFSDLFGDFDGLDIHAVLAACPCTDFAVSGARHFAAKDADGRTVASVGLVHQTLRLIEYYRPAVWAIENPVGRIEKLGGLPPWRLAFDPNHLGDPYTKKTLIWGRFNGDLPVAPVEPTEGSKMHRLYGGNSIATKNARSVTPEGFAYGFFMANNAIDNPVLALGNKYDRLDRALIEDAVKAGLSEDDVSNAVDDAYYQDLDDDAAEQALRDAIQKRTPVASKTEPATEPATEPKVQAPTPEQEDERKAEQAQRNPVDYLREIVRQSNVPQKDAVGAARGAILNPDASAVERQALLEEVGATDAQSIAELDAALVKWWRRHFRARAEHKAKGKAGTKAPEAQEQKPASTSAAVRIIQAKKALQAALEPLSFTDANKTGTLAHSVEGFGRRATVGVRVIVDGDTIQYKVTSTAEQFDAKAGRLKAFGAGGLEEVLNTEAEAVELAKNWQTSNRAFVKNSDRPKHGEPGYTVELAREDLAIMQAQPGASGYVRDSRQMDKIRQQEKLIEEMEAEQKPKENPLSTENLELASRHKKIDKTLDLMDDAQIEAVYVRAGLAGKNLDIDQKRQALKQEHPDDIEPLLKPKAETDRTPEWAAEMEAIAAKLDALDRNLQATTIRKNIAKDDGFPAATLLETAKDTLAKFDQPAADKPADADLDSMFDDVLAEVTGEPAAAQPAPVVEAEPADEATVESLEDELRAQKKRVMRLKGGDATKLKAAETRLRKMRTGILEAEDKLVPAARAGDAKALQALEEMGFADTADAIRAFLPANTAPRSLGDSLGSAGKNVASALDEAINGLGQLFGGSGRLSSGLTFDEETYAKAKPLFISAVANLRAASADLRDAMRAVISMVVDRFGSEAAQNMKPYVVRFIGDVRDGKVDLEAKDDTGRNAASDDQSLAPVPPQGFPETGQGSVETSAGLRPSDADGNGQFEEDRSGRGSGLDGGSESALPDGAAGTGSSTPGQLNPKADAANKLAGENPGNFRISEDFGLGEGSAGQKIEANLAAIRTLRQLRIENRYATPSEQAVMARYVGWGGLKSVFDPKKAESTDMYGRAQRELRQLLDKYEYDAAFDSVRNAHYTAKGVVDAMWRLSRHMGFNGGRALEPTVGIGNFIGLQPDDLAASTEWHASELDVTTSLMAKYLYPDANILEGTGFEEARFAQGVFDLAIGNPPFGAQTVSSRMKGYSHLNGMKIHNYIIAKTGMHLRPGGAMMMVVTHRFLDTANDEARKMLAKDFKFLGAIRMPNDAFRQNAGTDVVTDIVILQKYREGEARDKSPDWLDVNGSIEVDGKPIRVNRYFEKNPGHILGRSAMDGSMYAGRRDENGEGEYTVHGDGRDIGKAIDEIMATSMADLSGVLEKTDQDRDVEAVMLQSSDIPVGGLRLSENGRIERRDLDDADGNAVVEVITPDTLWKDDAREWEAVRDAVVELRDAAKSRRLTEDDFAELVEQSRFFFKADGTQKADPTKAVSAIYDLVNAASRPEMFTWNHDQALAEIEASLSRRRLGEKGYEALRDMLDLRGRTLALIRAELSDAKTLVVMRSSLNAAYDKFVAKHGFLSDPKNFNLLGGDVGAEAGLEASFEPEISAAVSKSSGIPKRKASAKKADILSKRVNFPRKEITSADSAEDAMDISLSERGKVDLAFMAKLLNKPAADVIAELSGGSNPRLFRNPETDAYEDAESYLSGNVRHKLEAARAAGLKANVKALEAVQPEPKTKSQVRPNIRGLWMPGAVFTDFLSAMGVRNPEIMAIHQQGILKAFGTVGELTEFGAQFSHPDRSVIELFNAAASGKSVTIMRSNGKESFKDEEATKSANAIVARMAKVFETFAYSDEPRTESIVAAFNERMNTHAPRTYSGEKYLRTVGASPSIQLRRTQKNGAWRMVLSKTMLADHVVGAGKTFTAIAGVMERRRLGLSKKPMIAVPNHLVVQWARDFYKMYPGAKVLAATPADFSKKNRRRLMARIATGDYDAVIVGHTSIGFIENFAADHRAIIDENIEALEKAMEQARESGESKRTLTQMRDKIAKYEDKLKSLSERATDEIGIDFKSLGVDYLVVDEAHEFKNLEYATSGERVVGMNDPAGSKRAFDLYVKVRGLLGRDGGVSFLTGTPVSNSLVEIYTMMRYLAHDELKLRQQEHFDSWSGAYASTETKLEYTATQKLKPRRVLAGLNNLSALRQLYEHFADIITMRDLKRIYSEEKAEKNRLTGANERTDFPIPKVKGGKRRLDNGDITEAQSEYMDYLVARMKKIESMKGREAKEYAKIDNALNVLTDARKMSLDIRVVDPTAPRDENGKVMRAAKAIKANYDKWNDVRGTQMIFCDLSTPAKTAAKDARNLIKETAEVLFGEGQAKQVRRQLEGKTYQEQWAWLRDQADELIENENLSQDKRDGIESYFAELEDADATILTADIGFSVYDDMRAVLVEQGIPESEIAFIHDYNTPEQKEKLFDRMNSGYVRVLMGSSAKMGAGTNAQKRLVALHHMDAPWRPSDVEQREGRIIRQGNLFYQAVDIQDMQDLPPEIVSAAPRLREEYPNGFEVEITAYSTNGTSDTVMWQVLERKAAGIEQFRNGGLDSVEEDSADSDQYAEFMATSTGNPIFRYKLEAERAYTELEAEVGGVRTSKANAQQFLRDLPRKLREAEEDIEAFDGKVAAVASYGNQTGTAAEFRAAMLDAIAEYEVKYGEWLEKTEEAAKEILLWEKEPESTRGAKPSTPARPPRPILTNKRLQEKSGYARAVGSALAAIRPGAGAISLDVGDGMAVELTAKSGETSVYFNAVLVSGKSRISLERVSLSLGSKATDSPNIVRALEPDSIDQAIDNMVRSRKEQISNLNKRKPAQEKLASVPLDESKVDAARELMEWYQVQVSFAEARAEVERSKRANRYIPNDRRRFPGWSSGDGKMEDPSQKEIEVDGQKYNATGYTAGSRAEAVRASDGLPVVIRTIFDEKGKPSGYEVIEMPESLREEYARNIEEMNRWVDSFDAGVRPNPLRKADGTYERMEPALFSRRPVKVSGATRTVLSHDAVKAIVERINARLALGTELAVYRSEAELFAAAPAIEQQAEQDGAKGEIKAVYHDGKVHVVTSAFAGNADVETAILDALAHEGQGHYGIRAMFAGNKPAIDAALREVFAAIGGVAGVKRLAAKNNIDLSSYLKTAEGMSDRQRAGYLADELLAHLQGKAATAGLTQRALNAIREYLGEIRNWLREHGFIALAKVNDADIALLLKRMREASMRNGATAPGAARFSRSSKQTDSEAFRRWFGDSKTLTKEGEPQVLYHGTAADFTVFDQTRAGSATGHSTSALGIFMSSDRRAAEQYAEKAGDGIPGYGKVMELYASIRNPYLMTVEESQEIENPLQARRLRSKLEQAGHDGIRLKGTPVWIAFNNYQVKSATDNNGEFDDFDPDIRFSRSTVRDMTSRATAELNRTFSAPGGLSWWHKTIGTMYNLAERSRHFKPVFESAQGFIDDVAYYAADAAEMAPGLLPRLETWADIAKKPITSADNKAVSKPIFEGTLMWSRDETGQPVRVDDHNDAGIVWKDAELRSMFGLNDRQIELYQEFRSATDRSLDTMARADMLRFVGEDAKAIQQEVMDAADHREAARLITEHLQQLAERSPKRFGQLMNAAQGVAERAKRVSELKAQGYAPLSRFGSYTVDVVSEDGERQYFGLFETKREANQMAEQMRAEFGEGSVSQGTLSQESYKLFAGVTPETLELFGGALGINADGDKAQDQVFQEYLRLTKNNRSAMKRLMHRKGVAGYSEDVGRVLASFVYSNARQTSAGLHMGDLGKAVDAIPKAQGELKDAAVRLAEYIKNPQEEAQAVRGLLFAQYLGGSVASAFVNLTQPAAVTFPWLSQYGGASKAAAALSKAARQMATKGYQYEADLAKALHAAEEDGTVSPQEVHQLMAQARGQGSLRAGDGTRAGDARALASNSLARLSVAWGKLFGAAEQVNRRMTFIAAYRMAKEQGMGNPAAFARRAVKETQFVYTKASKMRWGRGAVGGTLMTFKTYSISYLELMGRLWTQGEKGSVQRQEGRKAVLLMLAVLLLMGGAGGLPFADDAEDLIDGLAQLAGYNFSTQKAKEEFLAEVFGEEIGRFIDKGVSGIPGAPMDVSGRLGLGNLIPGTGLFQKREDHTRDVLEIAGPMGDFAGRIVSGSRSVLEGRVGAGLLEMSPVAVRNWAKSVDMGVTGMYRDDKGYKVLDTTILEAALKFVGFQPESVAKVQEANWLNQRSKAYYNQRAQEIRALWAKGIFERDPSKIQEAREAIAEWNAQNPEQRMIINMPSVMRRAREMAKRKDERIAATAPKAMRRQMLEEIRRNQGMED